MQREIAGRSSTVARGTLPRMRFAGAPPAVLVALGVGVAVGCGGLGGQPPDRPPAVRAPNGQVYYLIEKGPYKAFYDGFGRLEYIEHEKSEDGKPSRVVARYDGQKRPHRLEIDFDRDGRAERWEDYDPEGRLTRFSLVGSDSQAHRWAVVGPRGDVLRYEHERGGRIERVEIIEGDRIARVELDTNADGKIDRWQRWTGNLLTSEAIDADADGKPDRTLSYGAGGELVKVERAGT
jgi:hypothetical protein